MTSIYLEKAESVHDRLYEILSAALNAPVEIKRTENGKPYLEGNPLFFSISHSGEKAVICVDESPVGIDLELYKNKRHMPVIERFSDEEQAEILSEKDFLYHWTAREAFIKMRGGTLANDLKSTAYYGGNLYFEGERQDVVLSFYDFGFGVAAVCIEKENL
ncbi:MAG: 4'-phosphopantetheinyl transferase superfamily protein [Clostridia bacterium]|nr:4'-phosphopantetheinyl transferase superfamily protein [Clostridia bacterium]